MTKLEDSDKYPTAMGADREIEVMHALMSMPTDYLRDNFEKFDLLITCLGMSHIDGGIYDIRRSNEKEFFKFADWMDMMDEHLGRSPTFDSDPFRISFDDMVEEYPSMATWDEHD